MCTAPHQSRGQTESRLACNIAQHSHHVHENTFCPSDPSDQTVLPNCQVGCAITKGLSPAQPCSPYPASHSTTSSYRWPSRQPSSQSPQHSQTLHSVLASAGQCPEASSFPKARQAQLPQAPLAVQAAVAVARVPLSLGTPCRGLGSTNPFSDQARVGPNATKLSRN